VSAYEQERAALLNQFAATLRELREASFPSKEAFAEAANLNRVHIGYLEQARREPSLATLLILSNTLKVPIDRLTRDLPTPKERRKPPHRKQRECP
jgi:transcriptional regulator with XRE-family HTH domain